MVAHRGASPEPRDAATPKRPLSPSASGGCLGRWPKPWGWTASPEAPIQARRVGTAATSRTMGSRPSVPAPRFTIASRRVAGGMLGHAAPEQQPGQAQPAAEGGLGQRAPPRGHGHANQRPRHCLRGSRLRVPAEPPSATGEAGGRARTAGTTTTTLPTVGVNRRDRDPPLVAPSRLACMNPTQVPGRQPHGWCLLLCRGRLDRRQVAAPLAHPAHGVWACSR